MKTIGRTNNGNMLVEMSREEHGEFVRLAVVFSSSNSFWFTDGNLDGADLSLVFKALANLYSARHSINEIEAAVYLIKSYFGNIIEKEQKDA